MNARFIKLWQDLQASYYFIPSIMAIGAVLLAFVTTQIDKSFDANSLRNLGWFYSNTADGARSILSTIAGSMMTVAAVTFSITMVAVTSAAGLYGPRLVGNFMSDKSNQFTLGSFTATFIYCLLILRTTRTGDSQDIENAVAEFVPNVSLLVALILSLLSVGVLIFFVHHIPETLNVGNLTARVGRKLHKSIESIFPENYQSKTQNQANAAPDDLPNIDFNDGDIIRAKYEGFVQAINVNDLVTHATQNDCVVRLISGPGKFVTKGDPLFEVFSSAPISEEALKKFLKFYAMGDERTAHQNILFLADELVEILARALSPGVNDPFTAQNCLNWYESAMKVMLTRIPPASTVRDDKDEIRLITQPLTLDVLVKQLCDQSRQYIVTDYNTLKAMIELLKRLRSQCDSEGNKKLFKNQIVLYLAEAEAKRFSIEDLRAH